MMLEEGKKREIPFARRMMVVGAAVLAIGTATCVPPVTGMAFADDLTDYGSIDLLADDQAAETVSYTDETSVSDGWRLSYELSETTDATTGAVTRTASLVGYAEAAATGVLTVPETVTYGGQVYTVVSVAGGTGTTITDAKGAFAESGLTSVTLPQTVRTVDAAAFAACTSLKTVVWLGPGALVNTSIGDFAFASCTSLESVTLPDALETTGVRIFQADTALVRLTTTSRSSEEANVFPTVYEVGNYALFKCESLTNITFPAGVQKLGINVFGNDAALTDVKFEADSLYAIGASCFVNCTGLKKLEIPQLTAETNALTGGVSSSATNTFKGCTSLVEIVFKTSEGYLYRGATRYFDSNGKNYFTNDAALEKIVWEGKRGRTYAANAGNSSGANISPSTEAPSAEQYFTLYFYASEEAANEGDPSAALASFTYKNGTVVSEILSGTADASNTVDGQSTNERMAELNAQLPFGSAWSLEGTSFTDESTLDNTYCAYPVVQDHLDSNSSVTSPELVAAAKKKASEGDNWNRDSYHFPGMYYAYLDGSGIVNIDDIYAVSSTGYAVDTSYYTLSFEQGPQVTMDQLRKAQAESGTFSVVSDYEDWKELGDGVLPSEDGYFYRVRAVATEANGEEVSTDYSYIFVTTYEPEVYHDGVSNYANTTYTFTSSVASADAELLNGAVDAGIGSWNSSFSALVDASDPFAALVGVGFAGTGNGSISLLDKDLAYVEDASKVVAKTNSENVTMVIVGAKDSITDEAAEEVRSKNASIDDTYIRLYDTSIAAGGGKDSSPIQGVALNGYTVVSKSASVFSPEPTLADSVILCSPNASTDTMPVAQFAYETGSLVLFTEDDGTVSESTLAALQSFKQIFVAGDSSYVTTASFATVADACPDSTIVRIMDKGSAYANSLALVDLLEEYAPARDGSRLAHLHVAWADDADCVVAACEAAAVDGGLAVSVASEGELKLLASYLKTELADSTGSLVESIDFVGDFTQKGEQESLLVSTWTDYSNDETSTLAADDCVEDAGSIYLICSDEEGGLYALWSGLADKGVTTAKIKNEVQGLEVTGLSSPAVSTLGETPYLKELSIASGVDLYGVQSSFFEGAENLSYVYIGDASQEDALDGVTSAGVKVVIHDKHVLKEQAAQDATCTETGNVEYWECSICGELFSDSDGVFETSLSAVTTSALGHEWVTYPAKAATATEDGYQEYKECSRCGAQNPAKIVIPAIGSTSGGDDSESGSGSGSAGGEDSEDDVVVTTTTTVTTKSSAASTSDAADTLADASDGADTGTAVSKTVAVNGASTDAGVSEESQYSQASSINADQIIYDNVVREIILGAVAFAVLAAAIIGIRRYRRRDPNLGHGSPAAAH